MSLDRHDLHFSPGFATELVKNGFLSDVLAYRTALIVDLGCHIKLNKRQFN